MINEPTPAYDTLRAYRIAYQLGVAQSERCLLMEELRPHWPGYERRKQDYALALSLVDAQIAALPKHEIYPTTAHEATRALSRARKAKQVTWREYGLRMWFLRRAR